MAGDEVGHERSEEIQYTRGVLGSGGGVIDLRDNPRAFFEMSVSTTQRAKARLKLGGIFPEIVPQPGLTPPLFRSERGREGSRSARDFF
jgi:hypothetical protein